jgi:hypothetical protein
MIVISTSQPGVDESAKDGHKATASLSAPRRRKRTPAAYRRTAGPAISEDPPATSQILFRNGQVIFR